MTCCSHVVVAFTVSSFSVASRFVSLFCIAVSVRGRACVCYPVLAFPWGLVARSVLLLCRGS